MDPVAEPVVFPASYFVVAYLLLMSVMSIVMILLTRRRGGELSMEDIKYKVFEDDIPNPRTETRYAGQGLRQAAPTAGTDQPER